MLVWRKLSTKVKKFADTMTPRVCYLVDKITNKKIVIPHEKIKVIGRSEETEVKDLFVSKSQIELLANNETCKVKVKPVGQAICGIDGYATVKDRTYTIGHGHLIELRLGFHQFEVVFDPIPESCEENEPVHVTKKQKLDFPIFNKKPSDKETKPNISDSDGYWESVDNNSLLIYTPNNIIDQKKIAAFDIDGTIITPKSGARFPKDEDDWKFLYTDIPQKLKMLIEQGYKIVFFTNQAGLVNSSKIASFKSKIEKILKKICPVQVFIAPGKNIYRKPCKGMWDTLVDKQNNVSIEIDESFYVGDAAGRDKGGGRKTKDHSCADRLFAMNVGLQFFTPEEYFLKAKPVEFKMPEFDPRNLTDEVYPDVNFNTPNIIIMVGGPGSGKSHFCKYVLIPKGYTHINRDTLGSWQKCVKKLEESLRSKKNCVVDNTNLDKDSRARYIEVAKKLNAECRCFLMSTSLQHSKHNNKFRELTDQSHVPVSEVIINSFKKLYQEPEISEGFEEILHIPFITTFRDQGEEKLYRMFLLEK